MVQAEVMVVLKEDQEVTEELLKVVPLEDTVARFVFLSNNTSETLS